MVFVVFFSHNGICSLLLTRFGKYMLQLDDATTIFTV